MIPGILLEEHVSSSKYSLFEGNVELALSNARSVQSVLSNGKRLKIHIREFKIYDATATKTSQILHI